MTMQHPTDFTAQPFETPAFSWEELAFDARSDGAVIARICFGPCAAADAFAHTGPARDLSDCGRFREWLFQTGCTQLEIPAWPAADFADVRDVVLSIISMIPGLTITFSVDGDTDVAVFEKATRLWIGQVLVARADGQDCEIDVQPENDGAASGLTGEAGSIELELAAVLEAVQAPESGVRVEQKLQHLRDAATSCVLQERLPIAALPGQEDAAVLFEGGAAAANAIIPGSGRLAPAALHLGRGFLLRAAPSLPGGYVLEAPDLETAFSLDAEDVCVKIDPRPGKVIKHETVHALYVSADSRVRAAIASFKVLGHGERHIFMTTEPGKEDLIEKTLQGGFLFNEGWSFVGVAVRRLGADGNILAVLRTSAIWSDLNKRADLGDWAAADALHHLNRLRKQPTPRRRKAPHVTRKRPRLASPEMATGKQ